MTSDWSFKRATGPCLNGEASEVKPAALVPMAIRNDEKEGCLGRSRLLVTLPVLRPGWGEAVTVEFLYPQCLDQWLLTAGAQ